MTSCRRPPYMTPTHTTSTYAGTLCRHAPGVDLSPAHVPTLTDLYPMHLARNFALMMEITAEIVMDTREIVYRVTHGLEVTRDELLGIVHRVYKRVKRALDLSSCRTLPEAATLTRMPRSPCPAAQVGGSRGPCARATPAPDQAGGSAWSCAYPLALTPPPLGKAGGSRWACLYTPMSLSSVDPYLASAGQHTLFGQSRYDSWLQTTTHLEGATQQSGLYLSPHEDL